MSCSREQTVSDAGAVELLLSAARELRDAIGAALPAWQRERYEETLRVVRAGLGNEDYAVAVSEGQGQTWRDAVNFAPAGT